VPVLTAESAEDAERACEAILAGGPRAVEITFRTDAAVEAIRRASGIEGLLVGAGTVLSESQLESALEAGPRFAVAPSTNEVVVRAALGVNIDNLDTYLALPSVFACGGTWICEPALLRDGRFDEIERRAREATALAAA
jgi:2-keto-3-deoxy-6-phosphogluconate aldolase